MATKRKDEEVLRENVPAKRRKTVPSSWLENGKRKLQELRARMECERNWVIEVIDRKRMDDIFPGSAQEASRPRRIMKSQRRKRGPKG